MKIKLRKRYYCDHCKKSGGSSFLMKKHEDGCTLNPLRVCWMCSFGGKQAAINDLIEAARVDQRRQAAIDKTCDYFAFNAAEPIELRKVANGCPACMLAGLRQAKDVYISFVWSDETKAFLSPIVAAQAECDREDASHLREYLASINPNG